MLIVTDNLSIQGTDYHLLLCLNLQIGSVFEYVNQRPAFGVLNSDSVFYAPLLGFFAFTGIPTSVSLEFTLIIVSLHQITMFADRIFFLQIQAFLWFKSVQIANKEAEEQDRRDGYF